MKTETQDKKCVICGGDNTDYVDWFCSPRLFTNIEIHYHKRCRRIKEEQGK